MSEKITFPMDNPLIPEAEEVTKTKNEDHPDKKREELNRQAEEALQEKYRKIKNRAEDKGDLIDEKV